MFSLRTGGKQNIDTSAEAQGQVDTSYYGAGFDKLRTPAPTKLRRGAQHYEHEEGCSLAWQTLNGLLISRIHGDKAGTRCTCGRLIL